MKRVALLAVLFGLVGCGGSFTPAKPVLLQWTGDGNPLVQVCGASQSNCKLSIKVSDLTTGGTTTLPITALSFQAPDQTHSYSVQIVGFDNKGNPLTSACCQWKP